MPVAIGAHAQIGASPAQMLSDYADWRAEANFYSCQAEVLDVAAHTNVPVDHIKTMPTSGWYFRGGGIHVISPCTLLLVPQPAVLLALEALPVHQYVPDFIMLQFFIG